MKGCFGCVAVIVAILVVAVVGLGVIFLSTNIFGPLEVKPVSFTASTRGDRYLRSSLDNWLLSLDPNGASTVTARRFGEKING